MEKMLPNILRKSRQTDRLHHDFQQSLAVLKLLPRNVGRSPAVCEDRGANSEALRAVRATYTEPPAPAPRPAPIHPILRMDPGANACGCHIKTHERMSRQRGQALPFQ